MISSDFHNSNLFSEYLCTHYMLELLVWAIYKVSQVFKGTRAQNFGLESSYLKKYNKYKLEIFNFNVILPKVNTDYIRQAQVLNIDNLRLTIYL